MIHEDLELFIKARTSWSVVDFRLVLLALSEFYIDLFGRSCDLLPF